MILWEVSEGKLPKFQETMFKGKQNLSLKGAMLSRVGTEHLSKYVGKTWGSDAENSLPEVIAQWLRADREKLFNQNQAMWGSWAMSWRADDAEALIAKDKQLTVSWSSLFPRFQYTAEVMLCYMSPLDIWHYVHSAVHFYDHLFMLCTFTCNISKLLHFTMCLPFSSPSRHFFFSEQDPMANILPHLETFGDQRASWLPGVNLLKWTFLNDRVNRLFL